MAVKMRLRREGKRKQPFYRIVVADVRSPRDGRFIEDLGFYHPIREPSAISIDRERALYWLRNGVQPSDAVVNLLRIEGIWEEFRPGEPDPNADRRAKRAAKRSQHQERLDRARAAQDEARRRSEEDKAAADAAEAGKIVQQAAEEVVQQPSSLEPGSEETVVDDVESAADEGVEAVERQTGPAEAAPAEDAEPAANADAEPAEQPKESGS